VGEKQDLFRKIPSVDVVVESIASSGVSPVTPRWALVDAARQVLGEMRESISSGVVREIPSMDETQRRVLSATESLLRRGVRRVINGTGIIIHTNLGRSPLGEAAIRAVDEIAGGYSSLEYDLEEGGRTSRTQAVEATIRRVVGSEDAFIVNNNAGAVLIALNALAEGRETLISRGEQVEIGGSFRLPDVMDKSGCRRVEVGTTNRTRLDDYARAVTASTACILKVHLSNFEMKGFVESVSTADLAGLAHDRGLVMIEDLGSGALVDLSRFGIRREPMPQDSLAAGVDVVTFSGDKLLGGAQAGIIVGRRELLTRMKRNPLARALRVDKLTLAITEETLRQYLEPDGLSEALPTLRMIALEPEVIERRVDVALKAVSPGIEPDARVDMVETTSQVGGGSLPTEGIRSCALGLSSRHLSPEEIAARLRAAEPPVVARIQDDLVLIDMRTVLPDDDRILIALVRKVLGERDPTPEGS
jgi:L-seryl-tRNA(Ser) seleniumtransferase